MLDKGIDEVLKRRATPHPSPSPQGRGTRSIMEFSENKKGGCK